MWLRRPFPLLSPLETFALPLSHSSFPAFPAPSCPTFSGLSCLCHVLAMAAHKHTPLLLPLKTGFHNTIFDVMKRRGWKETHSDMDWDFHW